MNWGDLLAALALVMIIEGLIPFISPRGYKNTMQQLAAMPESTLRNIGFGLILCGVVFLYLVRG
ncbi:MAG: DUF2065 domain-containing protein [Gammaproteobacteria bacterium]|nr:DUF2065 domain-containing protein [Gammaproteobacteria bacterium]MCZ6797302.1 DUF2065 domain-containing protein [Gammaproteobacteria bacterium]